MIATSSASLRPTDVLATAMLAARPSRAPDLAAEVAAFRDLSLLMAADPGRAIQQFTDLAIALCRAGSAGVSLLATNDKGELSFHWDALAGAFAPYVGGNTPRDFSPCGLCLDQGTTILVSRPGRVFHYLNDAEPEIVEGLVVPVLGRAGEPLGTIWVVHHDEDARFDAEDARVMEDLAVQLTLAIALRRDASAHQIAMQDVRHRLKNTLTVAVATLRVQARTTPSVDARMALEEALSRLGATASAHEFIPHAGATSEEVEIVPLLSRLLEALRHSPFCDGGRVGLHLAAEPGISLPARTALPLALLVNEAVTNACKYAFPHGRRGEIEVRLERHPEDGALMLTVRDNGVGLPAEIHEASLGLKLIQGFARQMGGSVTTSGESGTTISLVLRPASAQQPNAVMAVSKQV